MNLLHRCDCNLICQFRKLTAVKKKKKRTACGQILLTIQILPIICMSISFIIQILSSTCILILFIIHIYCRPHVCRYCILYKCTVLHMHISVCFFTQTYCPLHVLLVHIKLGISSTVLHCNEIKDQQNRSHLISTIP